MIKLDILTLLTKRAVGKANAIDSVALAALIGSEVNVASSFLHHLWQEKSLSRFVSVDRVDALGRRRMSYRYYVPKSANVRALLLKSEAISGGRHRRAPGFNDSALVAQW